MKPVRLQSKMAGLVGAVVLVLSVAAPSLGQSATQTGSSWQNGFERFLATPETRDVAIGTVDLDGRNLFTVTTPAISPTATSTPQPNAANPLQQRIEGIELKLNRIVESRVAPETLRVTWKLEPRSNLPIVLINDQYLMTVTTLDAQVQGQDITLWSDSLTQVIQEALIQAKQERQPIFLFQQALRAAAIILAVLLSSWLLTRFQRRIKARLAELEREKMMTPPVPAARSDTTAPAVKAIVQRQLIQRQQRNLTDMQRRLVQVTQVGLWVGGACIILGLFPYSRWLQPLVLSTPLKILGIALSTYLAIRVSAILVDRFFETLEGGEFIDSEAFQRLALRVSTFSRVLKSITQILWIGAGLLTTLSVVGVDLVPLLAGAGIVGLAISFASQNLIKDIINGFLILVDDQYAVGDVIKVGEVSGLVENMTLRITQLRDTEGRLITVPNSAVTIVQNLSKDWSRVDVAIDISHKTNPDAALEAFSHVSKEMYNDPDWQPKITAPPEVLGIDEIDYTGFKVRVWIKTKPLEQWKVAREFRRRLKLALDERGIAIGVPQEAIYLTHSSESGSYKLQSADISQDSELSHLVDEPKEIIS